MGRAAQGVMGAVYEQVRAALVTENGETRFREEGGRCVLLRDDGLCPIQAAYGAAQQAYIGNVNSKKFHLPTCPNLPAEKNQILFSSYDEAVAAGYTPCSTCIK